MDPERFPSGINSLVDYVHQRGLRLGLYTCAGERTCKFNRTGSGGHYQQDANWFAKHNVDLVKIDNCGHPGNETPPEYMGAFSEALNATGVPIELALCEWGNDAPWTGWGAEIAQSYRTTMDHLPFWTFNLKGSGQGVIEIINAMADVNNYSVPFGYGDPDFLELGLPTLSETEGQTEFTFWALFGGPMLLSTDVRNMSSWKQSVVLNDEILSINYDSKHSPGGRVTLDNATKTQVWSKHLASGQQAVALLNYHDSEQQTVSLTWEQLGWPAGSTVAVYDLWAHASLGNFKSGHSAPALPPHGSAMWRLTLQS